MKTIKRIFGWVRERRHKVSWWAPYWSYAPAVWREWSQLFRPRFVMRVTLVSGAVFTGLVAVAKFKFPLIQLGGLLPLALIAVLALFAYFLFMCLIHLALPQSISVGKQGIHIVHGQSHWMVGRESIRAIRIVVFSKDMIRLRIFYQRKGKRRTRTVGIRPAVDLRQLSRRLPVRPEVWDARALWAATQRG